MRDEQTAETMVLMDRCPLKISGKAKTNGLLYMQHIQRMEKGLGELKRLKHPASTDFCINMLL